jgi:hypothetical protein
LGHALFELGEREGDTSRLQEAAAAYQAALEERTRKNLPIGWAKSLRNHGKVLMSLAERGDDLDMAERALSELTDAFEAIGASGIPINADEEILLERASGLVRRLEGR